MRKLLPVLLLAVSVPVVYAPIASGRYTISGNPWSADSTRRYLSRDLPLWDPTAGALQDEPWLHEIRRNLREGRVALVNLRNGLGAPLVESLQSGALYVANPLLLLTSGDGPRFFDLFSLAHVALLVVGLYLLLRCYARPEIAGALAILVGFAGATYHNVNMVHFRGYAWLPWMLLGAVHIARRSRPVVAGAVLVGATVGAVTAGNLQDGLMSLGVVTAIGGAEALLAPVGTRARALAAVATGLAVALAIAAPASVPYLASVAEGNLASMGSAPRCLASGPLDYYFTWVLPRALGTSQIPFRRALLHDQQPDFTTTGFLLLCMGLVLLVAPRLGPRGRERAMLAVLFGVLALFVLKFTNVWPLTLCASVPLVSGIRFTKYCLQQAVVAAMILAIAAEHATRLAPEDRRRLLGRALLPFGAAVAALLWWMWRSEDWHFQGFGSRAFSHLAKAWGASIVTVPLFALLVFLRRRPAWIAAATLFVVQAALVLPTGYWRPYPERAVSAEGLRHPEVAAEHRVASNLLANTNLFFGIEDVAVFDPVLNGALHRFLTTHFEVRNPAFQLQFDTRLTSLTPPRVAALRLVSVDLVEIGADASPSPPFAASDFPGLARLEGTLPRVYIVDPASAAGADASCAEGRLADAVEELAAAARRGPALREIRDVNRVLVENGGGPAEGVLVLSRAHTTAWRLGGATPAALCGVLSTWPVSLRGGDRLIVEYRPPGLALALRIAAVGAAALLAYLLLLRRWGRHRNAPAPS
jgi:hypothetical protein